MTISMRERNECCVLSVYKTKTEDQRPKPELKRLITLSGQTIGFRRIYSTLKYTKSTRSSFSRKRRVKLH